VVALVGSERCSGAPRQPTLSPVAPGGKGIVRARRLDPKVLRGGAHQNGEKGGSGGSKSIKVGDTLVSGGGQQVKRGGGQ
jgi:hypothetical protein